MSEFPHEDGAWDLDENEVLEPSDSLEGDPEDEALDQGVALPDNWSRALRHVVNGGDEFTESLDEHLAEEEPDPALESEDESPDEGDTGDEVDRKEREEGEDPRAGRLVAGNEEMYASSDTSFVLEDQLTALDTGIDGGAASAEEAAVHVTGEDEDEDDEDDEQ
jgi:hypothetical protein